MEHALAQSGQSGTSPDHVANALHHACALVLRNLHESMGDDGSDALMSRAASRSTALHPLVSDLRDPNVPGISRERLAQAVEKNATATQTAVEAVLANLIEILARLIGDDMALRIITRDGDVGPNGDGATS